MKNIALVKFFSIKIADFLVVVIRDHRTTPSNDKKRVQNCFTVEEVQRLYGLNKANIHHIAKVNGIGEYNGDYRKIYR